MKTSHLLWPVIASLSLSTCTQRKSASNPAPAAEVAPRTADQKTTTKTGTGTGTAAATDSSTASSTAKPNVHVVIVPGWGYQLGPLLKFDYNTYAAWLTEAGTPKDHIHIIDYDWKGDIEDARLGIEKQFQDILAKGGDNAVLDIIGHSLGGFMGPYAGAKMSNSARIRKFISVSGIPFGWDNSYCKTGICGKTHLKLIPFQSDFVMAFHKDYADFWKRIDKCAIYSPADSFVKPYNAGKMDGGVNKEIANMGHLQTIGDKQFFTEMLNTCYGGKAP